jgi:flagellar biosynthetic protein FliR
MEDSGSALDQLFLITAMLIFLVINGHHIFLQGLKGTFDLVPLNSPLPDFPLERLVTMTGGMIVAAVRMALPLMGTLLLTDVTLGLVARVAPQVHVFFLGIPLKVGVGLLALGMVFTILLPSLDQLLRSIGTRTLELLGA